MNTLKPLSKQQRWYQQNKEKSREIKRNSYKKLRSKAIEILGGKCNGCDRTNKLQLHHNYYARDSIRPKIHREAGYQTILRTKEAIAHPGRFSLLCLSCHNSKEPRRKSTVSVVSLFENDEMMVN